MPSPKMGQNGWKRYYDGMKSGKMIRKGYHMGDESMSF